MTFSGISTQGNDHTAAKMFDGDLSTEMWIAKGPYSGEGKDTIAADAYIQITFPEAKQIGSIRMTQGKTSSFLLIWISRTSSQQSFTFAAVAMRRIPFAFRSLGRSDVDRHGKQFCRRIR